MAGSIARQEAFNRIIRYIKCRPCSDCKGTFPPECMEFDHREGTIKRGTVSSVAHSLRPFVDELEKCDVVCANCHNIRTAARR